GDNGENGEPAAELAFTEQGEGLADAVDFAAEAEDGGIQIAEKAVEQGRLELEEPFDAVEVQIGGGDGVEQLELNELVAGNFARLDHGRLTEEVSLEIGEAEAAGFIEVALRFHFFREQGDIWAAVFGGEGFPRAGIKQLEIDFEEVSQLDEGPGVRSVHKIVESEEVAGLAKLVADGENLLRGLNGFQDLHNNAVRRKQPRSAKAQGQLVYIDEGAGMAGQKLEIEQGYGICDDAGRGVGVGLEGILRAATEEQFVGEHPQAQIKDRLAGYELFMHRDTTRILHATGLRVKARLASGGRLGSANLCLVAACWLKSGGEPPHSKGCSRRQSGDWRSRGTSRGGGHGVEEFHIGLVFAEAADQELHGLNGGERAENLAKDPNAAQFVGRKKQFILTSAGSLDVDCREHALIGETAVEIDFHIAGALEFLEDDVVHAAAGVDQGGGDDGERAAFFDVASRGKEAAWALQGVGINTAAEYFTGRRGDGVVSAGEACDGVQKDNDVALVLDEALGFFENHFRNLDVALGRLVECGADDFTLDGALHVRDFFRTFVDEEHDQSHVRMIDGDGIGDGLQHHGFAGARRRIDQTALTLADRAEQVQHAAGQIFLGGFHFEAALRIKRGEVVKEDFVAGDLGVLKIDSFNLDEGEVALAVLGRADLAGDGVAGTQVEFANLRWGDVDVVGAGEIVIFRCAEEAEAVRQALQNA